MGRVHAPYPRNVAAQPRLHARTVDLPSVRMNDLGPFCDCTPRIYGYNPGRPHMQRGEPGWTRCWTCGGLWDRDGNDVLAPLLAEGLDLRLSPERLAEGRKEK